VRGLFKQVRSRFEVEPMATPSRLLLLATVIAACAAYVHAGSAQVSLSKGPPLSADEVNRAVAGVQAFYDGAQTFKSDFQQTYWVKAYNVLKSSSGEVTFAKPGKMDWAYSTPQRNRLVSDGTVIKFYDAGNKTIFQQPIHASQYPLALSFLTGTGKLAEGLDFQIPPEMKFAGGYVLVGTPKQPTPTYAKILFYVDAATSQVRRVIIMDGQGNRNRFDFEHPRVNDPVAPGQFTFTPPPGTTILP
jgi:outer membrane lipoprotein carrier protein